MQKKETEVITFNGGNGSSVSEAIEINGANSFSSGLNAIFNYFEHVCGFKDISFIEVEVILFWYKTFHKINVCTNKGWSKSYFFNTTNFQEKICVNDFDLIKNLFTISN
jgi:hypothetical protein